MCRFNHDSSLHGILTGENVVTPSPRVFESYEGWLDHTIRRKTFGAAPASSQLQAMQQRRWFQVKDHARPRRLQAFPTVDDRWGAASCVDLRAANMLSQGKALPVLHNLPNELEDC